MRCSNNLKQMTLACLAYSNANVETFPPAAGMVKYNTANSKSREEGSYNHCFTVFILPYIDQQVLYDSIDFKLSAWDMYYQNPKPAALTAVIPMYYCPSYQREILCTESINYKYGALWTYNGVGGVIRTTEEKNAKQGEKYVESPELTAPTNYGNLPDNGMFCFGKAIKIGMVPDGLSNTLFVSEYIQKDSKGTYSTEAGNVRPWVLGTNENRGMYAYKVIKYGINVPYDRLNNNNSTNVPFNHLPMGSDHADGVNAAKADGSVAFLNENMDVAVYKAMGTRTGGSPENNLGED